MSIRQLEAYNYKCLQAVRVPLGPFHVLLGRNGTGWFRNFLKNRVFRLQLHPALMRYPCPFTASEHLDLYGSNLPKVVMRLQQDHPKAFEQWLDFLRIELPLGGIECHQRREDNALYLLLHFHNGGPVPQWAVSDGTLRLLALTILPYLPPEDTEDTVWLIEEPENGVHPQALELMIQALHNLAQYGGAQVLVATHSLLLLDFDEVVQPAHLLRFRLDHGATKVERWEGKPSQRGELARLFGSGVL